MNPIDKKKTAAEARRAAIGRTVDLLAKGSAVHAFRNGPVEDMHAAGQLSDADMRILNKYMADRLGEVFALLLAGRIEDLTRMLAFPYRCASGWDPVDLSGLEEAVRLSRMSAGSDT